MLIDLLLQKIVSKFKQRMHILLMLFAIIYVGFAPVDVLASGLRRYQEYWKNQQWGQALQL